MSAPDLYFIYNHGSTDSAYGGTGLPVGDWKVININSDKMVFTGGGILGSLAIPTVASGTRDATIRPSIQSYIIPQVYVETDVLMYNVPMAGYGPSASQGPYRYVFGVYVDGTMNSDLYLEAWDDFTFSTYTSTVLVGSTLSGDESYINAIRTTGSAPPWAPGWNGSDAGGAYLRGTDTGRRVPLANASSITDQAVYWNMYIRLETDSATFHNTPILGFRYLYT